MTTAQQPVIEATLFRVEQLKPFFKKLDSYRDERMLLSFPRDFWMELRKPSFAPGDAYVGDSPYEVLRIKSEAFPAELPFMYNLARLFDERNVRVEAYANRAMELKPIDPLSMNELLVKLVGFADHRKQKTLDIEMTNTARIWRIEQLLGLTDWVNSYPSPTLELCVSSQEAAGIRLQKLQPLAEEPLDSPRYDVTGTSHEYIAERIANIFEQTPVTVEIRNKPAMRNYLPVPPVQLEPFLANCAKRYRDSLF